MNVLEFKFCPVCKGDLETHDNFKKCTECGYELYFNPTPGVSVYPVRNGETLLAKRGIDPFKGEWDSIGGFMNFDETAEEGIKREMLEETGLSINKLTYLGTYPSLYGDENSERVVNIYYIAEVAEEDGKAKDDITELKWFPIKETDTIKSSFDNVTESLKDLRKWYSKNK